MSKGITNQPSGLRKRRTFSAKNAATAGHIEPQMIGDVANIKVIKSTRQGMLDKAAIRALKKWKYKTKILDGVAVVQKDMKVRLQFDIEDES